ncbi:hypothetical protein J0S82_012759, partial [Galemys pyrenaicus]
ALERAESVVSAPRTAAHAAAGAPAASEPPILALSPPCALGAVAALRATAEGLRGLPRPASGEGGCGRETLSYAGAPNLPGFRGGCCCVSSAENKSLSWRGGAPAFLLLFLQDDRSRSKPRESGFAAISPGDDQERPLLRTMWREAAVSAGAGRGAWAAPLGSGGTAGGLGRSGRQDCKRVVAWNDRTSLGDPGPGEPESFPPPLLLPAHRKLSQAPHPPIPSSSTPPPPPPSISSSWPHNSQQPAPGRWLSPLCARRGESFADWPVPLPTRPWSPAAEPPAGIAAPRGGDADSAGQPGERAGAAACGNPLNPVAAEAAEMLVRAARPTASSTFSGYRAPRPVRVSPKFPRLRQCPARGARACARVHDRAGFTGRRGFAPGACAFTTGGRVRTRDGHGHRFGGLRLCAELRACL